MNARQILVSYLMLVSAESAFAADAKRSPDPVKIFARKDTNKDGALTLEEFKAGLETKVLENAEKRFKKIDTDGDGKLSLDEFKAGRPPNKS